MTDKKDSVATPDRLAMSRALGAAFLNHQVEQLEKSISDSGPTHSWRQTRNTNPRSTSKPDRQSTQGRNLHTTSIGGSTTRRGIEEDKRRGNGKNDRDADIIIIDSSVLIFGVGILKKWCREGRREVVVVPLEVLNTLDLMKKGTSTPAQRARTASRILEAQVGTNPRIRVQRDDAFVLWDDIPFKDTPVGTHPSLSPEWVRRTICCARWELDHAKEEVTNPNPKVVLAVIVPPEDALADGTNSLSASSPVPLPAPQTIRLEPRSSGALVGHWAAKARVNVLEFPWQPNTSPLANTHGTRDVSGGRRSSEQRRVSEQGRRSFDEDRTTKRGPGPAPGRGRRNSYARADRGLPPSGGLVERPPAVMAMMEAIAQPTRVVRVLARGEKLDPDP